MNKNIIENNFNLKVSDIELLDKHFGTELYVIKTDVGKYIVKILPLYMENIKNECELTEYLYNHGLKVARFMKSKEDTYVVKTPEFLGQTALLLKDYEGLSLRFGKDFFSSKTVYKKLWYYKK